MGKHSKLYDVVLIRSFAIIMVVAFHAYGMMYANHFPSMTDVYHEMYYNINQLVLKFRMPLFIFISGYLFAYLEDVKSKYPTFMELLKNKFKRLIVPYFIFGLIYMLTTNSFSWRNLLSGGVSHLWFITMLFGCFILTRVLKLCYFTQNKLLIALVLLVSFTLLLYPEFRCYFLGIQTLHMWYFWFFLGYVVSPHKEWMYKLLSNRFVSCGLVLVWILGTLYTVYCVGTDDYRTIPGNLSHLCIVLLIWYAINFIIKKYTGKWLEGPVFKELNRTSYGIFVLHNWLQLFMISKTAQHLFHLDVLAENHVVLFPLFFFLLSLLFSYVGAVLMLKTKVGRFLIG